MKRRTCQNLMLIVSLIATLHAPRLLAAPTELVLDVPVPPVEVQADSQGAAVFICREAAGLSQTGEPGIPWQVMTVVLPPDARLETVVARLEGTAIEHVPGQWNVAPVGPAATWSDGREVVVWPTDKTIVEGKDAAVYGNAAFWPESDVRVLATGRLRKWRLAQVAVPLVKHDPVNRRLQRLTAGKLIVACERPVAGKSLTAAGQDQTEWADRIGEETVSRLAANYEQQSDEYEALTSAGILKAGPMFNPAVTPRFVIITTSAIQTASTKLADFVTHKQSQGFDVSVITESDFGGGTGDTAAENIRNWLISHYITDNIEYVLLIGDPRPTTGTVPMKILYPRNTSETVPSDVYYADLTGNWNLDGDAYYGEYSGDTGTGGADRFWEVIVGRIPYYGTIADLDNILQKTMDYQNQPAGSVAWRRSALLPMKDPDVTTLIYRLGEQIKNDTLVPAGWSYHRVYDLAYSLTPPPETMPCSKSNVTNVWKTGSFGLVLWATHGSQTEAVSVMDTSYAAQLSDNFPAMAFQCSCNNAYPETTGNLCYTLLKKGVVSTVAATRETWYEKGQMNFRATPTNNGMAYRYASRIVGDNATAARALYDTTMGLDPGGALYWQNYVAFNVHGDPSTSLLPRCQRRYVNAAAPAGGDGTSWATAYQDLQKALADDWAMEIWVAAGTYRPDRGTGNRAASFHLSRKTAVYGGFAGGETSLSQRNPAVNVTILSGDLAGDDGPNFANNAENSYRVVTTGGCDASSVLDGFVIKGGNANGNGDLNLNRGGGMYNAAGSSPVVSNCLFTSNRADYWGGAMCNDAWGASPTVVSCTFDGNRLSGGSGGGAVTNGTGSRAKFVDCLFTGNSANYGGALQCGSDYTTLLNCVFVGNTANSNGGAVYSPSSKAVYIGCRFHGNTSTGAGGAFMNTSGGGTPTLVNCVFSGNTAQGSAAGGAIFNYDAGSLKLVNCTFTENVATSTYANGGGLRTSGSSSISTISNCIFWGNHDRSGVTEASQVSGTTTVINYSCVQGWTGSLGGTGNTGADPQMPDPNGPDDVIGTADDDPRVLASSPCTDAGDNNAVPADTPDLDGDGNTAEPLPFDLCGISRFTDTFGPDSGTGTPPIVDMGVCEGGLQAFLLSAWSASISEAGTGTFMVRLALDPGGTVQATVARVSGDADITVQSGASLTFDSLNYAVPQTVTLAAAEDADNLAGTTLIQVTASGMPAARLTAIEVDNEPVTDVLYVDVDAPGVNNGASWAGAYVDLQTAMGFAATHSNVYEIRVAQGTYKPAGPSGSRNATFQLRNGLTLKGGYAGFGEANPDDRSVSENETILSGDLNGNDTPGFGNNGENSYHVVTTSGTDVTAVLDGFTVTAGNANGAATPSGAGLLNVNGSPTILTCTFQANSANNGAGVYDYQNGNLTLNGCRFISNTTSVDGGGLYVQQAGASVVRCQFLKNNANNNGGGIALSTGSSPLVANCIFSGNTSGYLGGGMFLISTEVTVANCSFVANSAVEAFGGLYDDSWETTTAVANCIFWGNLSGGSGGYWAQMSGADTVNYCCIEGFNPEEPPPGEGNHGDDPLFVDADGPDGIVGTADDNLRLSAGSPCIDAASNSLVPVGVVTDLDLGPRFVDDPAVDDTGVGTPPIVDMGAYEKRLPGPPTDYDGDSDVDGEDAELFEACASGPGIAFEWGCEDRDFDGDDDVDQIDFAVFQGCVSGEGVPADLSCAD